VEVELQAKNSMVDARENTINELRESLDSIKAGQQSEMEGLKE